MFSSRLKNVLNFKNHSRLLFSPSMDFFSNDLETFEDGQSFRGFYFLDWLT